MDLSFTPDQDALREATTRLYAKESHGERVREAEAAGIDPALWHGVVQMGLPTMAVPEPLGGAGASLTDLAVAVEVHGAHVGTVPLVETAVAARLLATLADDEVAAGWLARLVDGASAAVCLQPLTQPAARALVAYAAVADLVLVLGPDGLEAIEGPVAPSRSALSGLAIAEVGAGHGRPLGGQAGPLAYDRALDEWRALTAVAQAGLARASLDVGLQYAKDRHQFGVPIGSFQVLQHRFADLHTRVDGSRLLAYQAVWAHDEGDPTGPGRAAQASWYCGAVAEESAEFSLHVHGGYGFMLEYDVQLHLRRAKATRL
ncbi:MAG: acyl-CoA dehydrogenase family protein, partial [Acidimicrobiales bacterium]|nr:acyl-CoA dehydrogenase family protein [Acidimicrobiales bacterium]